MIINLSYGCMLENNIGETTLLRVCKVSVATISYLHLCSVKGWTRCSAFEVSH